MITLVDVNKSYAEGTTRRVVLKDVSLTVQDGEFIAIQGASGSGKSTLLNLIAGLDAPDSGMIEVDGNRIDSMTEHQRTLFRRRHIGFVFQFFGLIPSITVRDNIGFSLELNNRREEAHSRVNELLGHIGLSDRGDSFPDRLSGGEQQRVAIARAVAHRPALLLADEPTGNLDADAEVSVMELLGDMHQQQSGTLVIATHSHAVAARAHRVVQLQPDKTVA